VARHPSIMLHEQRLRFGGGMRGKANGPACAEPLAGNAGWILEKSYGVGFFGAIAAGFAAGIAAAFGLQNPGSALIQSSLT
jgi:hypothetical protein